MDWGLMTMDGENKLLRDEIVYGSTVSGYEERITGRGEE